MDAHGSLVLLSNLVMVLLSCPNRWWFLPSSKDLLNLAIHKGKLPEKLISFINIKNLNKGEYRMYTVLAPATTTAARNFRTYVDLKFFLCLVLDCQFSWPLLID